MTSSGVQQRVETGFHAQLRGASLWDLVQMECMGRARRAVRIVTTGDLGHLFFDAGRIVHATTRKLQGEAAALEILSWEKGSFEPCERDWPAEESIHSSHEALILQVAKVRDENSAPNLLEFPAKDRVVVDEWELDDAMKNSVFEEIAPPAKLDLMSNDFSVAVRMSATGAVVKAKGDADELVAVGAYAFRLVQLIGDLLGMESFSALECTFKESRLLLFAETNGDVVAVRPRPDANLTVLRERLGL